MQREWRDNNESVYSSDAPFPHDIVRLTGSGTLRKYAYAAVSVCPIRYRPQSGELLLYDEVHVTIHYSLPAPGSDRAIEIENLKSDRLADERASELFVNYDQIKALYEPSRRSLQAPADIYNYVIITSAALVDSITSTGFIAWKTSLGYSVRIVLISDPEITSQSGVDLAEQIRNFLRSYYGIWGIHFVLIVGDYATVPMRYSFPDSADHTHYPGNSGNAGGSVPSDNYYADLSLPDSESWDSDGDGFHGEYLQDNPDFLAEVYVGRIPTSDGARIAYALDKLVTFEQDEGAWKNQALQPGSMLFFENQNYSGYPKIDGSTLLNKIETDLMGSWTVSRYTEREGLVYSDFLWPAVSISAFLTDWRTGQYGVVNWSGHGAPYGVARTVWIEDDGDGVMETDGSDVVEWPSLIDIWGTLDDDYPSIVFAVSCNVGYPEPNGVGNLGIDLLTEPGFGAAAGIVSSTRPAWISADVINNPGGAESVCYEFNRYGVGENERLGEALYHAKYYCYQNYGWDHYAEHINQCNFNLYGDPSMMRTEVTAVSSPDYASVPEIPLLMQNCPNPFNPVTVIRYELPRPAHVKLCIYNVKGELIKTLVNRRMSAGRKEVSWDGRDDRSRAIASGVYFYRLIAGDIAQTRKMILLR
jgi:hypothetical protein